MLLTKLNELDQKQFLEELRNHVISYQSTIGIDSKYTFGIEIEFVKALHKKVEANLTEEFKEHWNFYHDSSLNELQEGKGNIYGGEMASKVFCDEPKYWRQIEKMCHFLLEQGASINSKCGGHIHIGTQALKNKKSLKRFLKLWIIFEDIIYRFGYGKMDTYREQIMEIAAPLTTTLNYYLLGNHKINLQSVSLHSMNHQIDFYKRRGVDFSGAFMLGKKLKNNTIEFRCPNGSLDPIIWQNNIRFFLNFLLCSNHSSNWDIIHKYLREGSIADGNIDHYGTLNIEKSFVLADFLFEEEQDKKNFLKQYIKSDKTKKIHL